MGFFNYKQYLKSSIWKSIRATHLKLFPDCYGCGSKAQTVHHGRYTYANLFGASRQYLYSICHTCHKLCEFSGEGKKLKVLSAMRKLKEIRVANGLPAIDKEHPNRQNPELDEKYRAAFIWVPTT